MGQSFNVLFHLPLSGAKGQAWETLLWPGAMASYSLPQPGLALGEAARASGPKPAATHNGDLCVQAPRGTDSNPLDGLRQGKQVNPR